MEGGNVDRSFPNEYESHTTLAEGRQELAFFRCLHRIKGHTTLFQMMRDHIIFYLPPGYYPNPQSLIETLHSVVVDRGDARWPARKAMIPENRLWRLGDFVEFTYN